MPSTATPAALSGRRLPNVWDIAALCCVVGLLVAMAAAARGTLVPLDALEATPIDLDPGRLPEYALRTTLRMFAALFCLAPVHLHLCPAGGQKPAGRADHDPGARHPAVGADPGLPVVHRRVLHEPVPRPGAGAGAGGDLRHLHQPGLEHGVQLLPVADHHPGRPGRGHQAVPPDRLAALLAAGSAVRHAGAGVEHHAVDVGGLVLRGRLRGDHAGRQHLDSCPASAPTWPRRWRRATSARCSGRSAPCWW